ncbi:Exodeoxyribonuclease 7 large subunit [Rathayibacter tanaceti]|uniref:Exodeoxyribonuclease 7 large subunit n=1 Tax=Rathayibacter tanaceti TaxID=1671680 RepID=A0A166IQ36_9MICO|nr:Exodeoxyribonuclease 7 large subunit [Rathayibacter tanaceti]
MTDAPPTADSPWPVGLLASKIKGWIERLGTAWVEGEITQWGVSGGNVYGKLKDLSGDATVGFTVWSSVRSRLPADLAQGDRVIALVKPNYWLKGGTLSMQVFEMRHVGLGDLLEKLERLRRQLASEGLFEPSRKKPLPFLPHGVGLITGKDSDARRTSCATLSCAGPPCASASCTPRSRASARCRRSSRLCGRSTPTRASTSS